MKNNCFPVSGDEFFGSTAKKILLLAGKTPAEVTLQEETSLMLRFTGNEVHQNCFVRKVTSACRLHDGGRTASAFTSGPKPASLKKLVENARALLGKEKSFSDARPPLAGPRNYRSVHDFDASVLRQTPLTAAKKLVSLLHRLKAWKGFGSGYYAVAVRTVLIANSAGLETFHRSSACRFGLTLKKGSGTGYASHFHPFLVNLESERVIAKAKERASLSARPVKLKPGRYPVVLAPRAAAEFLMPLWSEFSGLKAFKRESFLWDKKGKRCFDPAISIEDDVFNPSQTGLPFDGEGMPKIVLPLIEDGVVKNFVYNRRTAHELRKKPTAHGPGTLRTETIPINVVIKRGEKTFRELLKDHRSALFIPHLWYHQVTDQNTLMSTGVAKGNALVWKNGTFVGGVPNCRYLHPIPEALTCTLAVSRESETIKTNPFGATVLPYLSISDFRII